MAFIPLLSGDGYVRSEGIGAILLQKSSVSHRCYATVVHAKSNTDGYKEYGESHIFLLLDATDLAFPKTCLKVSRKERAEPHLFSSLYLYQSFPN